MPEQETLERARRDKRAGKAPSTQAGEFIREEIHHVREGKHGARSAKQAIASRDEIESTVRIAVQGQDGADVRVLEFDRSLRPVLQETAESFVVRRLVNRKARELIAKHGEVVANRRLDLLS